MLCVPTCCVFRHAVYFNIHCVPICFLFQQDLYSIMLCVLTCLYFNMLCISTGFVFLHELCFDMHCVWTCFVFQLPWWVHPRLVLSLLSLTSGCSREFSLGLIIFWRVGAYVDSAPSPLIPALGVPLDVSVLDCTLGLYSCTPVRVNTHFKHCCSVNNLSPLFGLVPW